MRRQAKRRVVHCKHHVVYDLHLGRVDDGVGHEARTVDRHELFEIASLHHGDVRERADDAVVVGRNQLDLRRVDAAALHLTEAHVHARRDSDQLRDESGVSEYLVDELFWENATLDGRLDDVNVGCHGKWKLANVECVRTDVLSKQLFVGLDGLASSEERHHGRARMEASVGVRLGVQVLERKAVKVGIRNDGGGNELDTNRVT